MARFRDGELDVLVGTTVVEVGVDVPEATMMVVEGADRFGLAQLHQLRGRVGRGTAGESFCVLVSEAAEGTTEHERLKAVAATTRRLRARRARLRAPPRGRRPRASPRAACRGCGSRRSQNPLHRELAAAARAHAETLVGEQGEPPADPPALRAELEQGWLRRVFAGEPASAA